MNHWTILFFVLSTPPAPIKGREFKASERGSLLVLLERGEEEKVSFAEGVKFNCNRGCGCL